VSTTRHIKGQLLPIAAVAGKPRDLPGRHRPDLAEADLGHHPLEAGARDAASGRTAKVVVDDLDLMPAQGLQPLPHGILERPALAVVQDLVGRGLPHVEDGLAIPMVRPDRVRRHRPFPCWPSRDPGTRARG
jgi:hypothetical protein